MLEAATICAFAAGLMVCIGMGYSIIYALLFGYALFFAYGLLTKHRAAAILKMSLEGVRTIKNILFVFVLIGMITAVWRASGTIPAIICYASRLIVPSAFFLIAFLLCCLVSVLTGTAFGTAATIGVICMSISDAMGLSRVLTGGAILSGVFFGDRCSPMSTSALLISELTKTDIFRNIRAMVRTAAVPFTVSCLIYLFLGMRSGGGAAPDDIEALFSSGFRLHWVAVLPAALIIFLSLFKLRVKITMSVSILVSCLIGVALQGEAPLSLARYMLLGYHAANPALAPMIDGGGLVSMLRVSAIVCISSSYAGIFNGTELLGGLREGIMRLSASSSPFISTLLTSVVAGMVACNQTLAIMLTHQLCAGTIPDREELAVTLENTVVVIAPLVPWSIAGAVPLSTVGAPFTSMLAACYLYLIPGWNVFQSGKAARRRGGGNPPVNKKFKGY